MLGDMAYSKLEAMACYLVKQACCNDILASVKIKLCSLTWKTGNINTQVYLQLKPSFRIAISDTKFKYYLITSILAEVPAYLIRFWASRWVNFDVSWVRILWLNFSLNPLGFSLAREKEKKIATTKNRVVDTPLTLEEFWFNAISTYNSYLPSIFRTNALIWGYFRNVRKGHWGQRTIDVELWG